MFDTAVDNAVIGINSLQALDRSSGTLTICPTLVATFKAFPSLISRDAQCDAIFWTKFLQLCHDTARDDWATLSIQTCHHLIEHLKLVLYGMRQEIGIDQDIVRWFEGGVVLEEET